MSIWHLLDNVNFTVKISSIFVAFLENTNFILPNLGHANKELHSTTKCQQPGDDNSIVHFHNIYGNNAAADMGVMWAMVSNKRAKYFQFKI